MNDFQKIIYAYAKVARPVLLGYMGRRSCIGSAHAGILALGRFGVDVQPVPADFHLSIPSLAVAYVAGIMDEEKFRGRAIAKDWVDLDTGDGWNGHVLLTYHDQYLIDPSFDQAFASLADGGVPVSRKPRTMVFPLNGNRLTPGMMASFSMTTDEPATLAFEVTYRAKSDDSYRDTPAWNDEALPYIADIIVLQMRDMIELSLYR